MTKVITKVYHNGEEYQFGGSGGGAPLPAIADLVAKKGNNLVKLTWTDPTDVVVSGYTLAYWKSSKVVRKVGSAPVDSSDGTLIYTETTRNSHTSTAYVDNTAVNDTTYYYAVFAVANNGEETISNVVSATPKATQTFTMTYTETSGAFSPTYSDDASGLTAGDTAFDEFYNYSAVRLNASGVETAEVTQTTPGQLNLSSLGTLTSGDNVMIKFPRMGIKMSKNGSTVTLSITDDPDATADGFQYYAHSRGTFNGNKGTVDKDAFYLGAFKATNSSNVLKSWSNASPVVSITQANSITYARANDGNDGSAGYDIIGFYQREFVNALYLMKYGSADSQTEVGLGYTGASAKVNTGGTVSQLSATYGTTSNTQQVKLFGLEDRWGNVYEWIGGMCTDGNKNLWTALSGFTGGITTASPYANTETTIQHSGSYYCLSSVVGSNKGMFAPTATVNNSSYNTYYCDYANVYASRLAFAGGGWSHGSYAGAFRLVVNLSASNTSADVGARLMFL